MVRTRKQSRREEEAKHDESGGANGMVVFNEYEEGALTSIHSVTSVRRTALRVQEVKKVSVDGEQEEFFVTRPVPSSVFKQPRVLVGTTPIVVFSTPQSDTIHSFGDLTTAPFAQEVVTDGYNNFYITRPCISLPNQDYVPIVCKRPVYLFTTRKAAEAYIMLNFAEFGASAHFECEYTHLNAHLDLLILK